MKFLFYILIFSAGKIAFAQKTISIKFQNSANGKEIVLNDSMYSNVFGEKYRVSKLKYYVSNIHFITGSKKKQAINVFLINAASPEPIILPRPSTQITGVEFLLGVDSSLNCTGAQSGALDPLNDMFWTWNSGYIMFKLEGCSDSSKADQHRIEQHIGGYAGDHKTMRLINIPFTDLSDEIIIRLDLDQYWNGINKIKTAEMPVITTPGTLAVRAANNFPGMFSIKNQ